MKMIQKIQRKWIRTRNKVVDRWLTWRTGKTKPERDWEKWVEVAVIRRASTIQDMFRNFKHIIPVNHNKFMDLDEPFGWYPNREAQRFLFPKRKLGNNAVWVFERGSWNNGVFDVTTFGDMDQVFVACNDDHDALMITLKFVGP